MVKGLDRFRERFREFEHAFTLIGGAACHEWFTALGLPFRATALIPLKAHAWLNLTKRRASGAEVDSRIIAKHKNDLFRLAATLPGKAGPEIAQTIKDDLILFLAAFPEISEQWPAILASLKETFGGGTRPAALRSAIQIFFRLPPA